MWNFVLNISTFHGCMKAAEMTGSASQIQPRQQLILLDIYRKDNSRNWGNLTRNGLWLKSVHWALSCTGRPGSAALVGLQMNLGQMVLSPDVSRAPFKVVTAAIVKWERDYQILTCSDTFLLVGLTITWLYKMNDIDIYLTFIISVHLVYDIPNHCAHYHCIGLVTFLLNTTRIPMTQVPWILNSLLLHLILSHKLTMTCWESKVWNNSLLHRFCKLVMSLSTSDCTELLSQHQPICPKR